ncbi:MAG: septal ring lytic transglycosylase RlpA family protein [Alphaproteobacteria bacterium]|nr:MAG: septal ring lytic transglycosylase RlpA family protein [Alphaproteobacteria bacterium]
MKWFFIVIFLTLTQCWGNTPADSGATTYVVKGKRYKTQAHYNYAKAGLASWYGPKFHMKKTASGEIYNQYHYTAAHRTLPLNTIVRVTNLHTKKSVLVLISDRGPYPSTKHKGCRYMYKKRLIDLSYAAAKKLDGLKQGVFPVQVVSLPAESRKFAQMIQLLKKKQKKNFSVSREFHRIYT